MSSLIFGTAQLSDCFRVWQVEFPADLDLPTLGVLVAKEV